MKKLSKSESAAGGGDEIIGRRQLRVRLLDIAKDIRFVSVFHR